MRAIETFFLTTGKVQQSLTEDPEPKLSGLKVMARVGAGGSGGEGSKYPPTEFSQKYAPGLATNSIFIVCSL